MYTYVLVPTYLTYWCHYVFSINSTLSHEADFYLKIAYENNWLKLYVHKFIHALACDNSK